MDRLAAACGATSFLATQHEAACRRLLKSEHPLWSTAASGKVWVGVCFAHLRRQPSPVEVAVDDNTLVFTGTGPWFSGLGLMDRVLVAGATEDQTFLMAQCQVNSPGILVGDSPALVVMQATATVPLTFEKLRVPTGELVMRFDAQEMNLADMHSTVYQASRSLGVARAAGVYLPDTARASLQHIIAQHHLKMDAWDLDPSWPTATLLRTEAIKLAAETITAAVMCVGGRAHSANHPLGRLTREASFYTTAQLTRELKAQSLNSLLGSESCFAS